MMCTIHFLQITHSIYVQDLSFRRFFMYDSIDPIASKPRQFYCKRFEN